MTVQLSDWDGAIVRELVRRYAPSATRVGVFGSRATGGARQGSDLDLVLYGPVGEAEADRLFTELEDSLISVASDVVVYGSIANPALKAHIDRVMQPMFEADDLRQD
jgi:type I restriction enzyme R subunit